jgi:hypothetical protein
MTEISQEQIINNLKKCPRFDTCSQNLCPLDLELNLRTGSTQDKCRWMRETKTSKIAGRVFASGGGVMPDAMLNFVPEGNLEWLNKSSQRRWRELKKIKT